MRSWILALLIALSAVLGAATLRATAQSVMTGPAAAATAQQPADKAEAPPASTPPASTQPAAPAGRIADDPTVAPDKSESADNNVSFPVDI